LRSYSKTHDVTYEKLAQKTVKIAGIIPECVVNGPGGISFTIFAQGCNHRCDGCHNPGTHDFNRGIDYNLARLAEEANEYPLADIVTFTGGDPFFQAGSFKHLASYLKNDGYKLVGYTGYYLEELLKSEDKAKIEFLQKLDLLIDGPFIKDQRDISLKFRGSTNQRIINVNKSLQDESLILEEKYM